MFVMDSRLQQDSHVLGDFPLCRLLVSKDANYPWFILVPKRAGVSELFDLNQEDQAQLWKETTYLAEVLKSEFAADKMNVATLGNVVSQMHMHVIVRHKHDAAWPAELTPSFLTLRALTLSDGRQSPVNGAARRNAA